MARRDVEREFAEKVRATLRTAGELEKSILLGHAAAYDIPEARALAMAEWIRRSEARRKPDQPEKPRAVGWDVFITQAQRDEAAPWAMKPYFPRALLSIVAGEQKSGKTLWVSWAVGEMLKAGERVLFVQLDTARSVLRQRLEPFLPEDKSGLAILFRDKDEVATDAGVERLLAEARAHGATCLIIDSLFRAMPGMDENDTNAIRQVTTNLERLGTESGAAVVVLHHVRKAGSDGRDDIVSADVRGGGGLLSSAAVVVLIQKRKAEGEGEARFKVTCGDTWFEPFKPLNCCVTFGATEPMQLTEDEGISPADLKRGKIRVHLLRTLGDSRQWFTTREVLRVCQGLARKDLILECVEDLLAQQQIVSQPGPRGAKLYRVSEAFPVPRERSETTGTPDKATRRSTVPRSPPLIGGERSGTVDVPGNDCSPQQDGELWRDEDDGFDT